jgi:hypothetical protein
LSAGSAKNLGSSSSMYSRKLRITFCVLDTSKYHIYLQEDAKDDDCKLDMGILLKNHLCLQENAE